ncbi:hypothetical protein NEIG_02417 [Nematocida sp. ERTm5]|nr:hypothetical protein NEIG_02417 [Nematocida sp. ERTm5]
MEVQEVRNETFQIVETEKKRKRIKTRKYPKQEETHTDTYIQPKSMPISEYISNSTNINHKIYRDILINRRNGERATALNLLK